MRQFVLCVSHGAVSVVQESSLCVRDNIACRARQSSLCWLHDIACHILSSFVCVGHDSVSYIPAVSLCHEMALYNCLYSFSLCTIRHRKQCCTSNLQNGKQIKLNLNNVERVELQRPSSRFHHCNRRRCSEEHSKIISFEAPSQHKSEDGED